MSRIEVGLVCMGITLVLAAGGLLWIWASVRRERRDAARYREMFERNRTREWWESK